MKRARVSLQIAFVLALGVPGVAAKSPRNAASVLMRIEPDTRLEQVCDIEAMHRIARIKPFKPDRAKSDVSSHPIHTGDAMKASGAAFRSGGQWYAFSFECHGTQDHMRVLSMTLKTGDAIPRGRWADLGLW